MNRDLNEVKDKLCGYMGDPRQGSSKQKDLDVGRCLASLGNSKTSVAGAKRNWAVAGRGGQQGSQGPGCRLWF